jgi:tetratricopeptide (TPR) repeat protein
MRALERAAGYLELGMPRAAWEELEELPTAERSNPHVLAMGVRVYLALGKLEEAKLIADKLAIELPDFALSWASMARVEAALGRIDEAKMFLWKAVQVDPKIEIQLLDDPLLERVWK